MNRGFEIVSSYKDIKLPERSTKFSAGYDFFCPENVVIVSHLQLFQNELRCTEGDDSDKCTIVKPFCIKTGIKAYMEEDEVLQLYMRSSAPSKLGLVMANSVGIIDSDYYNNSENEGEIGFLVYNLSPYSIVIYKGEKLGQGIFTKFLKIDNDISNGIRTGGFGSTGE